MQFERNSRDLGVRVLKGTTVLVAARLIVRSFSLINIVVLARLLTPADYGIAALALAAIGAFTMFTDLKLASALTALDKVEPAHLNTAFTLSLARGLIIAAALFASADGIAAWMDAPQLGPVLKVLSAMFVLDGVVNPAFWMYQRNLDFSKEFGRATIAQAFASMVTIAVAFRLESYWAIVAGTLTGYAANALFSYWRIPFRPRLGLAHWRELVGFSGWLTLQGIAAQLNTLAPRLLIPKMLSPAALGIYTIGREAVSLPLDELLAPLRRTFFPGFAAIKDDPERLRRSVRLATETLLAIALPVGIGIAMLSREIILVLAGDQWLGATIVLQALAPTTAVLMSTSAIVGLAMAKGELRPLFVRSLILAVLNWLGIAVGLYWYGFDGAIYALAFNQLCALLINLVFTRQLLGEPLWQWLADGWRSIVAAGAMAAVLAAIDLYTGERATGSLAALGVLLPSVMIGAAVYSATHLLLWHLARRPAGFESNVIHYGGMVWGHMRNRASSPKSQA